VVENSPFEVNISARLRKEIGHKLEVLTTALINASSSHEHGTTNGGMLSVPQLTSHTSNGTVVSPSSPPSAIAAQAQHHHRMLSAHLNNVPYATGGGGGGITASGLHETADALLLAQILSIFDEGVTEVLKLMVSIVSPPPTTAVSSRSVNNRNQIASHASKGVQHIRN
jgi:hypothetical protein